MELDNAVYDDNGNLLSCDVLNGTAVWAKDGKGFGSITMKEGNTKPQPIPCRTGMRDRDVDLTKGVAPKRDNYGKAVV